MGCLLSLATHIHLSEGKKMKFACVGDNCIDVYQNQNKWYCGGNPVNVAVYTVRSGVAASYVGVVGSDEYGRFMIDSLNAHGVDTSHVKTLHGETAKSFINLVDGERVFCGYHPGVLQDFTLSDSDIQFIAQHDVLVSGHWGNIHARLPEIRATGIPIAFDFATKLWDEVYESAIPYVDYAFFSGEQDDSYTRDTLESMCKWGVRVAVCTLGEHGSLAYDGKQFYEFGIIPTEVKDTMGAGDSYIAGFLIGVLKGLPVLECMKMGAECSSITLQNFGAW